MCLSNGLSNLLFVLNFYTVCILLIFCSILHTNISLSINYRDAFYNRTNRIVTNHYNKNAYHGSNYLRKISEFSSSQSVQNDQGSKWPWLVRLQFLVKRNRRCGGALISKNIVVTAAHCVTGVSAKEIKVHIGDYNVNNVDRFEEVIDVTEIVINPFHKSFTRTFRNCGTPSQKAEVDYHDIAIIVLSKPVKCNLMKTFILLPWRNFELSYYSRRFPNPLPLRHFNDCHVAGWGATYHLGPYSNVLLDAKVQLFPTSLCNSTCFYEGKIKQGMLCAGDPSGLGQDACQGDSGGPLMCKYGKLWYLIGIVSWGLRCGDRHKPGIYTDVGAYQNWMLKEISKRPALDTAFWNGLFECYGCMIKVKECLDVWQRDYLAQKGIKCPANNYYH